MILKLKKYRISTSPESAETNSLRAGDIIRRQYYDNTKSIYTLMYVESVGQEKTVINKKDSISHYIDAYLIYGDEPTSNEMLDFVRVTSLSSRDRAGAIYMTSEDKGAPFIDIVEPVSKSTAILYPNNRYGFKVHNGETLSLDSPTSRQFTFTAKEAKSIHISTHGVSGIRDVTEVCFLYTDITTSKDATVKIKVGSDVVGVNTKADKVTPVFIPIGTSDISGDFVVDIASDSLSLVNDKLVVSNFSVVSIESINVLQSSTKTRVGKLDGLSGSVTPSISGYGAYFERLIATGDVNISGTLGAGSVSGVGSVFYVGKIYTNKLLNSMDVEFTNSVRKLDVSYVNIGKTFVVLKEPATFIAKDAEWCRRNSGMLACFSVYIQPTENPSSIFVNGEKMLTVDKSISHTPVRQHILFYIQDTSEPLKITISGEGNEFTAPQLELEVDSPSIYQPTDGKNTETVDYGMWACKGGFGGTMQNPLIKLNSDNKGGIESKGGGFKINNDGSGHLGGGALSFSDKKVNISFKDTNVGEEVDGKIQSSVDEINKDIDLVKESAKNANNKIDNLEIGGRNFALQTKQPAFAISADRVNQMEPAYKMSDFFKSNYVDILMSKDVSVSFRWHIDFNEDEKPSGKLIIQTSSGRTWLTSPAIEVNSSSGFYSGTRAWGKSESEVFDGVDFRLDNIPKGKRVTITNFMVTSGNTPTDWSPAPEDAESYTDKKTSEIRTEFDIIEGQINANITKTENLVDTTTGLVKEATETATQINQTAEKIEQTATEVSKNASEVSSNKTSVEQTAKEVKVSASEVSKNKDSVQGMKASVELTAKGVNSKAEEVGKAKTEIDQTAAKISTTAKEVSSNADKASTEAGKATTEANRAKTEADKALASQKDVTLKQTEINQTASEIKLSAKEVSDNTAKATEASATATKKATEATSQAELAQAQATEATAKALEADKKAKEALASAGSSSTSYQNAKKEADKAKIDATTANTKALEAKKEADRSKVEADKALASQKVVTQKETAINQTASKVEISAKRSEDSAVRSEKAEASINLKADGIVMEASKQSAEKAIEGLEIGGRNLVNSKSIIIDGYVGNSQAGDGRTGLTLIKGRRSLVIPIEPETPYSISYDKLGANERFAFGFYKQYKENETSSTVGWFDWSDHSTKVFEGYVSPKDSEFLIIYFGWSDDEIPPQLKVEKGNKATDWSPSPEEYSTTNEITSSLGVTPNGISILGANIDMTGAVTFSMMQDGAGDTLIQGGLIKTEKLDVVNIVAKGIKADHIEGLTISFTKGTIGGWNITPSSISKNNVSLKADGEISNTNKWALYNNGGGYLASKNITWDSAGNIKFTNKVKVGAANLDGTIIEGGFIKTDLIEANSITADKINIQSLESVRIRTGNLDVLEGATIAGFMVGKTYLESKDKDTLRTYLGHGSHSVHTGSDYWFDAQGSIGFTVAPEGEEPVSFSYTKMKAKYSMRGNLTRLQGVGDYAKSITGMSIELEDEHLNSELIGVDIHMPVGNNNTAINMNGGGIAGFGVRNKVIGDSEYNLKPLDRWNQRWCDFVDVDNNSSVYFNGLTKGDLGFKLPHPKDEYVGRVLMFLSTNSKVMCHVGAEGMNGTPYFLTPSGDKVARVEISRGRWIRFINMGNMWAYISN